MPTTVTVTKQSELDTALTTSERGTHIIIDAPRDPRLSLATSPGADYCYTIKGDSYVDVSQPVILTVRDNARAALSCPGSRAFVRDDAAVRTTRIALYTHDILVVARDRAHVTFSGHAQVVALGHASALRHGPVPLDHALGPTTPTPPLRVREAAPAASPLTH